MNTNSDKILGGLYGLLIGDAVGVPFEFLGPDAIPPKDTIDFILPSGFKRAHRSAPAGAWSDDGAQALCLLDSLLAKNKMDLNDFAHRLVKWADDGYLAVEAEVFDIGNQTMIALDRFKHGSSVENAAENTEYANGNGSLMRVLPLALWHTGADQELANDAMLQSHITHAHIRSKLCCALFVLIVRYALKGLAVREGLLIAADSLSKTIPRTAYAELSKVMGDLRNKSPKGSGYVVDTLAGALYAVNQACSFEDAVRNAIALGYDTDTTAAVAGGLAGVIYGKSAISSRWLATLAGQQLVSPLANKLLAKLQGGA